MPSDDDDFGYGPTTPAKAAAKKSTSRTGHGGASNKSRSAGRHEPLAGPSKSTINNKRKNAPSREDPEVQIVDTDDQGAAHQAIEISSGDESRPAETKSKARKMDGDSAVATAKNGKGGKKGNGAVSRAVRHEVEETMDVDGDGAETTETEQPARQRARPNSSNGTIAQTTNREMRRMAQEIARLKETVQALTKQRDSFSTQLEELFRLRISDPENALDLQRKNYEARITTQEELIQELTTKLEAVDPATLPGKMSTLHFLTREAADEEKRMAEKENVRLRQSLKDSQTAVTEKDRRNRELEAQLETTRSDLKAEVERSKHLAARGPPGSATKSTARGGMATQPVPPSKNGQVINLYEDLTNILVTSYIEATGPSPFPQKPDGTFTCLYLHPNGEAHPPSIAFQLTCAYQRVTDDAGNDTDEWEEWVTYTPSQFDRVPKEELDFLSGAFGFKRDQLRVFARTLFDRVEAVLVPEDIDG